MASFLLSLHPGFRCTNIFPRVSCRDIQVILAPGLWMKSYSVTIQMKPLQQYFHRPLFIFQYFTNEIWDSSWILILGPLGSERVKLPLNGLKLSLTHFQSFYFPGSWYKFHTATRFLSSVWRRTSDGHFHQFIRWRNNHRPGYLTQGFVHLGRIIFLLVRRVHILQQVFGVLQ